MTAAATIYALASGRPPAAIAIIRISGSAAHATAERLTGPLPEPLSAAVRDIRHPNSGDQLDEALVLRFDGPASATGEDVVELHCHGGRAVVDAVLSALGAFDDLRLADPGEFTRRAFENGRIDLTEAEGLADLLEAETESQRRAALALAEGGLRKQIAQWQETVLALSAVAERAIDYVDDGGEVDHDSLYSGCDALALDLGAWLKRPRMEPLKDGLRVVIAGPPNAGKSSLLNAIAGQERAIVTAAPGTTRDHIEVPLSLAGVPILLTDTAGLRHTDDEVEAIGVARAAQLGRAADILVWMSEPSEAPDHPRLIVVHGKVDAEGREVASPGTLPVSSATGQGIAELLERVTELTRDLLPGDGAIALNRRQASLLEEAQAALSRNRTGTDVVLVAENLRLARTSFDRLTGRAGVEDVLDALFSRFCLGK